MASADSSGSLSHVLCQDSPRVSAGLNRRVSPRLDICRLLAEPEIRPIYCHGVRLTVYRASPSPGPVTRSITQLCILRRSRCPTATCSSNPRFVALAFFRARLATGSLALDGWFRSYSVHRGHLPPPDMHTHYSDTPGKGCTVLIRFDMSKMLLLATASAMWQQRSELNATGHRSRRWLVFPKELVKQVGGPVDHQVLLR
jgi:hypothetical protein